MIEIIHPNRPESWRNSSPPFLDPQLVEEVTRIGGTTLDGRPRLRLAWGQSRMQFRRGKERLLYIDERIPALRHTRHVLKRPALLDDSGKALTWETEFLKSAPAIVPEGWLYEEELTSIEWIGQQLWFVEQLYMPEERLPNGQVHLPFGTEEEWEQIRYEDWEDPELGMVRNSDVLGPFPRGGRYTAIMFVGRPFSWTVSEKENVMSWIDDNGRPFLDEFDQPCQRAIGTKIVKTVEHGVCYRPPGRDTVEAIRAGWHEREHRHIESAEQRGKNKFYEEELKRRAAKEERLGQARAYLRGEEWRWSSPDGGTTGGVGGGARAYISNTDALEAGEKVA